MIGQRAPSDREPLKDRERRVRSENGDLYFYGAGRHGNAFAVYDFLDDIIGCRRFSPGGGEKSDPLVDRLVAVKLAPRK